MIILVSEIGFNNDCFLELYSEKQEVLSEIADYHAVIITKYDKQAEYVFAVIR